MRKYLRRTYDSDDAEDLSAINENTFLQVFYLLLLVMQCLNSCNYLPRDIMPDKILYNSRNTSIKLIYFRFAKQFQKDETVKH